MAEIDILEIARQLDAGEGIKKEKTKKAVPKDWKPEKVTDYIVPEFKEPAKEFFTWKRHRPQLVNILTIIDYIKYSRYNDACTIMPFPRTKPQFIQIAGNKSSFGRLLELMMEWGLIEVEDPTWQWGARNPIFNHGKTYRYYVENERKFVAICKEHGLEAKLLKNASDEPGSEEDDAMYGFDKKHALFSSKIFIKKPSNYSKKDLEDEVTVNLKQNYSQLDKYQRLADEINETYYKDHPEMALRFKPHFTWRRGDDAIRKVGIRCTNAIVSAKKDTGDKETNKLYREEILNSNNLNLSKDVKSSVPRITLSMNQGEWVPETIDIYERIFKVYARRKSKAYRDTVLSFTKDGCREGVKKVHMRGYFDKDSTIGVHTRLNMAEVKDKDAVDTEMRTFRRALTVAEGGRTFDSEIFFHESCIYMDVLKELLDRGFFVWMCYDAFYGRKEGVTQEEFEKLVTEIVAEKANAYINKYRDETLANANNSMFNSFLTERDLRDLEEIALEENK